MADEGYWMSAQGDVLDGGISVMYRLQAKAMLRRTFGSAVTMTEAQYVSDSRMRPLAHRGRLGRRIQGRTCQRARRDDMHTAEHDM